MVAILLATACGPANHISRHHRGARTPAPTWKRGATPFQISLHDSFTDQYDLQKVRHWVMYFLMGEFARRDGPNSASALRLAELDSLSVSTNPGRVAELLRAGLTELDHVPDSSGRSAFIDREVTARAQQILFLHCFKPESATALDALGRLIALHGVCQTETWTETTIVVTFRTGWMYWIGEDNTYEHKILRVARDRNDLTRLSKKARDKTGGDPAAEDWNFDEDLYTYTDVGMLADSKGPEMRQQRDVSVWVNYDAFNLATVNVHPIPCCLGDGRWNGKPAEIEAEPWDWTRLLTDIFVNRNQLTAPVGGNDDHLDLTVSYDVFRLRDTASVRVLSETLTHRQSLAGVGPKDGFAFQLVTSPFFTGADSCEGLYQMTFRLGDGRRESVRTLPFQLAHGRCELLVTNGLFSANGGLPPSPRHPSVSIPDSLYLLVPVRGLPFSTASGAHTGRLDVYLINNKDRSVGTVQLGELFASDFGDSTGATLPQPADQDKGGPFPALIASFPLRELHPDAYLRRRIEIPRQLSDGKKVKRGMHTLWAVVSSDDVTICEAIMTNLRIE